MEQQEDAGGFYTAGRKFAEHIAVSNDKEVSTATLQALIRDLLPQHEELQEALRSIVARPDFFHLVKFVDSGKGVAQKCAFIESLRKIYSTDTVEAADKLVCGMMGLGVTTTESEAETIVVDTLRLQDIANDTQITRQASNSNENSHLQDKSREVAENLSPVGPSHSLRNLAFILVATFAAGGIWETMRLEEKVNINQKPVTKNLLPVQLHASKANWAVCRAAQDIREPTSTYGEYTKPLRDGLGRFAPPANTRQQETWWKYSCSEIPGIYDW